MSEPKERVYIRVAPPSDWDRDMYRRYGTQIPHSRLMVDVVIKHPDGRERLVVDETGFAIATNTTDAMREAESAARYQWIEGNYACDCNRARFFLRAGGDPVPDDLPCGDAYEVIEPSWLRRPVIIEHWGNELLQ